MLKIGWFATGRGQTSTRLLQAVLAAIEAGLPARVTCLFSNQEPGDSENGDRLFATAHAAGIPVVTLSDAKFRRRVGGQVARRGQPLPAWRRDYDREVARRLEPYEFDLGIMAGYLLILTDVLYTRWPILNLHPALPDGPIGLWQDVIWQLIDQEASESGVFMFVSTGDLDRGPPVTFCRYSLHGGDLDRLWREHADRPLQELRAEGEANALFQAIRERGVKREFPLVVETLRAFAEGRLRIERGEKGFRVLTADGRELREPLDLTAEVEAAVVLAEENAAPEPC